MTFRVVELLGATESGIASEEEVALLRLLTPIAKRTTGKQAVAVASEVLEMFGGAGYVEDTGLPALLRDAQVLPIWEGTTDVLALDVLRVIEQRQGGLEALEIEAGARRFALTLGRAVELALLVRHAQRRLETASDAGPSTAAARLARSPVDLVQSREPGSIQLG